MTMKNDSIVLLWRKMSFTLFSCFICVRTCRRTGVRAFPVLFFFFFCLRIIKWNNLKYISESKYLVLWENIVKRRTKKVFGIHVMWIHCWFQWQDFYFSFIFFNHKKKKKKRKKISKDYVKSLLTIVFFSMIINGRKKYFDFLIKIMYHNTRVYNTIQSTWQMYYRKQWPARYAALSISHCESRSSGKKPFDQFSEIENFCEKF